MPTRTPTNRVPKTPPVYSVRAAGGPPSRPTAAQRQRAQPTAPPVYRPPAAAPAVPAGYRPHATPAIQRSPARRVIQPMMGTAAASMALALARANQPASSSGGSNQVNAGTKPLAFTTDNKYVVKIGSEREEFAYTNANALGLDNVLVEARTATPANPSGPITSVTINGTARQLSSPLPRPQGSERLIATKRMGKGNAVQTFTMDIKIGKHTKSEEQFELEGHNYAARLLKWAEHDLKDSNLLGIGRVGALGHGSRARGYDVDPKGATAFHANQSHGNFAAAVQKLAQDVHTIRTSLGNNPSMVFIGSSLFCFVDLASPNNSRARILDPDHPILLDETATAAVRPATLMSQTPFDAQQQGKYWGKKTWAGYSQRHQQSFLDGLAAVEQAFTNQTI